MPCDLTNALGGTSWTQPTVTDLSVATECQEEPIVFFYSNRPEQLTWSNLQAGVLWADARDELLFSGVTYRIYLWHQNTIVDTFGVPQTARLALTLQNRGTLPLLVSEGGAIARVRAFNTDFVTQVGQCLAQAQLADSLDAFSPSVGSVVAGTTEIIKDSATSIGDWALGAGSGGDLVGAVLEFNVQADPDDPTPGWTLRTVYGLGNDSDATIKGKTTLIDKASATTGDGRGSWNATGANGRNKVRIYTSPSPYALGDPPKVIRLGGTGAHDECWLASDSHNPNQARTNSGRYGCLYSKGSGALPNSPDGIKISYFYGPSNRGIFRAYLSPRGGVWAGAIYRYGADTVPRITAHLAGSNPNNAILLGQSDHSSAMIPGTGTIMFRLAHAGGVNLPVNIVVGTNI